MTNVLITWGLVFLVGMLATHFLQIDTWIAWAVWTAVFFIGNMLVGMTMKKTPREVVHMWHVVNVLGVLLSIAFLADTIAFDPAKIMAIWLFIMGAAMFAGSHQTKNPEGIFVGLLWISMGIMTPLIFAEVPFLIGGLVIGLPFVIGGLLKK